MNAKKIRAAACVAEIVAQDGGIKAYLNGVLVSTIAEGQIPESSRIGFQSQVIPTRWRHIRIKVEA